MSLENTCMKCDENWAYLGMVMIDLTSNSSDTLALTECLFCEIPPENGETQIYKLKTSLSSIPDLKNVKFNFGYLCTDLSYIQK